MLQTLTTAAETPTESAPRNPQRVQAEFRRVGCLTAQADGDWNEASQRSLTLFNKFAATKFDVKLASPDVLDAVRAKPGRVCPLGCDHGYRADGDTRVKIACRPGYHVDGDNECARDQDKKPVATQDSEKKRDEQRKQSEAAPEKPQAAGQIVCNGQGCHTLSKGCRTDEGDARGGKNSAAQKEICN
jgi:hypothetical protein